MVLYLPKNALQLVEMESLLQELKRFVTSTGWTYAVIWKIGPDHRTPIWHQSYFNESEEREIGQAQRFESIYKRCQFTPIRPGYAYLAWQRQSPLWWTKPMEPVPTDEKKELFLTQAKIQTLVCFPDRAPADGSRYCVELASTTLVPEIDYYKAPIRDFISTSVAPHIFSTPSHPLLQEVAALQAITSSTSMSPAAAQVMAAAVAQQQDSAILTDISSQAAIHGEDEAIAGFGNLARQELEPYYPWTMSSSQQVSAGLSNYPLANLGDYNYPNFGINSISYGSSSPILEPFQAVEPGPEWPPTASGTTTIHGSRKGKEILVEAESELGSSTHHNQSLTLPPTSQIFFLEYLERLSNPPGPTLQQQAPNLGQSGQDSSQMVIPPSGIVSSGYQIPSSSTSSAGLRPIGGQVPPGHSPRSLFQPHRHAQFPRFGASSKRPSLIYKWATILASQMRMREGLQGPGSGGSERPGSFGSPATHIFDPKSPTSLAHDHLAAETHKMAERKRRSKMNTKLRTLISIVPIIDKKDKVSVLTSTIEYIKQLNSRLANIENREEAAAAPATTSRMEEEATMSMDREEELAPFSNVDSAAAGPSSSSSSGAPVVVVEGSPDDETWLIKVQDKNHSRSLIQLLNVFQELGLEVITVEYGTMNGWFRANVCIKNSRNSSTSSSELKETLCRVLETVESSPTGSD